MSLIRTSIRRPVTVCMITIGIIAFGFISFKKLAINLLPDLSYPTLTIETQYPGAAPEEVEYLLTRQIEEAVSVIPNLKRVTSISKPEMSQVILEFQWGRQMDFAILDVSKKMDLLRLPDDVEKPRILRYDPNQDPIVKVSVTGEMPLTQLRFFGEEELKKRLDAVPGVASVKVLGGMEEVIEVNLNEQALKRFGLTTEVVSERLRNENINRAGGSLYENDARFLVRTLNEFRSIEEIGQTIISRDEDKRIYLNDIATVAYGYKDREEIARIDGKEGIELAFYKEGDANTVQVSRQIEHAIKNLEEKFEGKVSLTPTYLGARFIENAVAEVTSNAMVGGLIAVIVLFLFLRDFRGTLIVALSIPISVFTTFFLMFQFGVSMNIMSLGGLALGIGMLVDSSIVVLESIFVRRSQGESAEVAAEKGTSMVSGAVIASTLTTIVVFLPIAFVKGVGGQLFKDLGLTVSFSLLASLVVALTLMPTIYALISRKNKRKVEQDPSSESRLPKGRMFQAYAGLLTTALRFRYLVLLAAIAIVFQAGMLSRKMGLNLVPEMAQGDYFVLLEMEEGTPIETTDKMAAWIEARLLEIKGVRVVFSNVGQMDQGVETRRGENLAQVNFALAPEALNHPELVLDAARKALDDGPNLNYQIGSPTFFTLRTPIEVEIYHDNRTSLRAISDRIVEEMTNNAQFVDIRTTIEDGNPEVQIHFDRETASKMGLSIGAIAGLLRDKIQGAEATRFTRGGRDIDIVVRLTKEDRQSLEQLENLTVGYRDGKPIFLSTIAQIETEIGPAQINRISQRRCAIISASTAGSDLASAKETLMPMLEKYKQAFPGSHLELGGQVAEMGDSFKSLAMAIALAIFLVYLVMASQFESLGHPFLILFTIPIGLVGGLLALYFTGLTLSVIALIGLIMLAGIVVNNAIVLIDYINQLRRGGMAVFEAIVVAGFRRMRPILMTTATTVLGLLPMALGLGEGAEMRMPLAVTVIGGLVFSTILTLIIIPVLYGTFSRGLQIPATSKDWVREEVTA